MRVCAAQIERLFYLVEALALEAPEPTRRTSHAPREPKPTPSQELNRLGAFLVAHYPDEPGGNHVDTAIKLLIIEEPTAQDVDDGRGEG